MKMSWRLLENCAIRRVGKEGVRVRARGTTQHPHMSHPIIHNLNLENEQLKFQGWKNPLLPHYVRMMIFGRWRTNVLSERWHHITLFKATTMFCRMDSSMQKIRHIQSKCREYCSGPTIFYIIFLPFNLNVRNIPQNNVPHNIVVALNNVMQPDVGRVTIFYLRKSHFCMHPLLLWCKQVVLYPVDLV